MENFILSHHATIRCQQRGISSEIIDTILQFGRKRHSGGNTFMVFVPKKKAKKLKLAEKVFGIAVIVSDEFIVTVEHIYQRIRRKKRVNRVRGKRQWK